MLCPFSVTFGGLYAKHAKAKPIIGMTIRASDLNLITLIDGDITLPCGQVVNRLNLQTLLKAYLSRPLGGYGDG